MPTKILVIDEDIANADLMSILLKTLGFDVVTANTSAEGIELTKKISPNVILLDIMMPDVNGGDVCKTIRTFSNAPILILSAINDPAIVASVLDAGADDFLVKPVPGSVLVAHIRKTVRQMDMHENGTTGVTSTLRENSQPLPS